MIQWLLTLPESGGPITSRKKRRALARDTKAFLVGGLYLQFRRDWETKLRQDRRPAHAATPSRDDDELTARRREAEAARFLLEELADPHVPEAKKAKKRRLWLDAHPDSPPPWEDPSATGLQADAVTP